MLKIFLTGDNHIGLKYASHSAADVLCKKRMEAFEGMVQKANDEECALFVVAGDLFENTGGVAKRDIKTLVEMLSRFRGTVAVLPGNHDYYDPDVKVWAAFADAMASYDNILLLTKYMPYTLSVGEDKVILYPAHCTTLHSEPGKNNLGWMKEIEINEDAYHIGIAHGAVEGETIDKEGAYFLMSREELEAIPMDVWLLGHTHVPFPRSFRENTWTAGERIFNAGTHVQTDVSCNTEGVCFIIEINEQKEVKAENYVSGNVRFYRKTIPLSEGEMERKLQEELKNIGDESVVDLILTGAVSEEEYNSRHAMLEKMLGRFIEGTYRDGALTRRITKELIAEEFSETSFLAGLLTKLLSEPKEAQLAYDLIQTLKGGK